MNRFLVSILLSAIATLAASTAIHADDLVQQHDSKAVWFDTSNPLVDALLVIEDPNGEIIRIYADIGTPVFVLSEKDAIDGVYRYELRAGAETYLDPNSESHNNTGRSDAETYLDPNAKPYYSTGRFVVEGGAIITPEPISESDY